MAQLTKAEALKGEKQEKERELQQLTDTAGASGHQKLRVCDICGAYLSILDSDRRLADHFGGKVRSSDCVANPASPADAHSISPPDASRLPSTSSVDGRMAYTWSSAHWSCPSHARRAQRQRTSQRSPFSPPHGTSSHVRSPHVLPPHPFQQPRSFRSSSARRVHGSSRTRLRARRSSSRRRRPFLRTVCFRTRRP